MYTETVTWVHHWSERTFSFGCTRPLDFVFEAGQFVLIGLVVDDIKTIRPYSIVSAPDQHELEFLSVIVPNGELTSNLCKIEIGSQVCLYKKTTGTLVNAALTPASTLWMLATGTGLAPFMSLVRDPFTRSIWSRMHVVHSVRHADDLAYQKYFQTNNTVCEYHPLVTGQGDARISPDLLINQYLFDPAADRLMLCGNQQFNSEISAWCQSQGMTEGSVKAPGTYVREKAFIERPWPA